MRNVCITLLLLGWIGCGLCAADWRPPADGRLTETQVVATIAAMKDFMDASATSNAQPDGALDHASTRFSQILAQHDLEEEEWNWALGQLTEAWAYILWDEQWTQSRNALLEKQKQLTAQIASWRAGATQPKDPADPSLAQAESELAEARIALENGDASMEQAAKDVSAHHVRLLKKHLDAWRKATGMK